MLLLHLIILRMLILILPDLHFFFFAVFRSQVFHVVL